MFDWKKFFKFLTLFSKYKYFIANVDHLCANNQTHQNGRVVIPSKVPVMHGYFLDMVDHIRCKMNMVVVFKLTNCQEYDKNTPILCLMDLDMQNETYLMDTHSVQINQQYMCELLSILKYDPDTSYCPHIYLFTFEIWLTLIIAWITYSVFIAQTSGYIKHSKYGIPLEMLQIFFNQHSNIYKRLLNNRENIVNHSKHLSVEHYINRRIMRKKTHFLTIHRLSIFILIITWIFCMNFLTRSFSSILLKTYFTFTPTLTVQTLEDLASNPGLGISGFINSLKYIKPKIYRKLNKRLLKYEKSMKIDSKSEMKLLDIKLLREVEKRKVVLIVDTFKSNELKNIFPKLNLKESDHKYGSKPIFSYVSKTQSGHKKIVKMLTNGYENGLIQQTLQLFDETTKMYGLSDDSTKISTSTNENIIRVNDLYKGPIIYLISGIFISILVFIVERLYETLKRSIPSLIMCLVNVYYKDQSKVIMRSSVRQTSDL